LRQSEVEIDTVSGLGIETRHLMINGLKKSVLTRHEIIVVFNKSVLTVKTRQEHTKGS
jgi:hypothetical protein